MAFVIKEATVQIGYLDRRIKLKVVKAPDPDSPCVGCALRFQRDCLDECEDFIEEGNHFELVDPNDPAAAIIKETEEAHMRALRSPYAQPKGGE